MTLSDRICKTMKGKLNPPHWLEANHVRESVKRLKSELCKCAYGICNNCNAIDAEFGEKLI